MTKQTRIDHGVLQMALVGFELQRERIEALMTDIRAELSNAGSGRSTSTEAVKSEPKTTGKKRFSAAARKRMAAAQKKRWADLKAKKAEAGRPKRKPTGKRKKSVVAPARKQRPVQLKAAKKTARKVVKATPRPKAKVADEKAKKVAVKVPNFPVETVVTPVPVVWEPAPATE